VIHNQLELVIKRFWYGVNQDYIHPRKEGVKWLRELTGFNLLPSLRDHELTLPIIPGWMLRLIMSEWIFILGFSPRPKTFHT
jgi:hypothetical protein